MQPTTRSVFLGVIHSIATRFVNVIELPITSLDLELNEISLSLCHNSIVVQVRAFAEWPGAKAKFNIATPDGDTKTLDLKIITTRLGAKAADSDAVVKLVGDALVVPCGDNTTLEILELQPPGKKVMRAKDFCNGLRGQQILVSNAKPLSV